MSLLTKLDALKYQSSFEVDCTIDIENTASSLHAHVTLDDDIEIRPGDAVTIHGDPVQPEFGEKYTIRRRATVQRANFIVDHWTRFIARIELTELLETSFSEWRKV